MARHKEKLRPLSEPFRRTVYHALASFGYRVERLRDPYLDTARIVGPRSIDLAVDGGAYRGAATLKLLGAFPAARVLAFEPMPTFAEQLRVRFAGEPRVEVVEQALSADAGPATFHIHTTPFTSSLLEIADSTDYMQVERNVEVQKVRLDDVLDTLEAHSIIVKLDLQGHEHAALQGMVRALTDGRVRALIVEVNFARRYAGGCSFADIVCALGSTGFGLHRLYDLRLMAADAYEIGDAVFVRAAERALAPCGDPRLQVS